MRGLNYLDPDGTRIWYVVPAIIVHQKLTSRCDSEQRVVDVEMPGEDGQKRKSTFNTIEREESFKKPPKNSSTYPILNEFVTPHIESFNALFDDSGLPKGDGDGTGLLSIGLKDIGERVVFDGTGQIGTESGQAGWGNRLSSEYTTSEQGFTFMICGVISLDRRGIDCASQSPRSRYLEYGTESLPFRGICHPFVSRVIF